MSDKAKAVKPGEGMTREQLVRAHFDAYSDLAWKEHLEPKFERSGLDADAMRRLSAAVERLYREERLGLVAEQRRECLKRRIKGGNGEVPRKN